MTRKSYLLPARGLVVFWTPKAACTSVANAVCEAVADPLSAEAKLPRDWLKDNGYIAPFPKAQRVIRREGYRSIALLRDPYDRLISAYINKFVARGRRPLKTADLLEGFARVLYGQLMGLEGIDERTTDFTYDGLTFSEFVNGVCDIIDGRPTEAAAGGGPRIGARAVRRLEPRLNPHWNTQVPFWFEHTGFRYDELYTINRSEAFFCRLAALLGCARFHRVLNASHYGTDDAGAPRGALIDINSLDIGRSGIAVTKPAFESEALRRRVRHSYAVDYRYIETAGHPDTA